MKGGKTTLFDNPIHSGDLRSLSNEKKRNIGYVSTLAVSNLNEKIKELFDDNKKNSLININYLTNNGHFGKESNANLDENIQESLSNVSPNNGDDDSNKKSENRSIQNNQSSKCDINCGNIVTDLNRKKFKKGKWTKEEDQKLLNLIEKYSFNWKIIKSKFRHRTLTQIKQRYMNNLNPNINRSKFTNEEDRRLELYYSIYGTNWKKISSFFEFRPPNFIKNRFYTKHRTFLRKFKEKSFSYLIETFEYGKLVNLDEERIDTTCHNCNEDLKNLIYYIDSSNINKEYEYIIYEIILTDVLVHINNELDTSLRKKPKNKVFSHLADKVKNILDLLISKFNKKEDLKKDENLKNLIKRFNMYMNTLKLYALP